VKSPAVGAWYREMRIKPLTTNIRSAPVYYGHFQISYIPAGKNGEHPVIRFKQVGIGLVLSRLDPLDDMKFFISQRLAFIRCEVTFLTSIKVRNAVTLPKTPPGSGQTGAYITRVLMIQDIGRSMSLSVLLF
jgi:hypothetical protein